MVAKVLSDEKEIPLGVRNEALVPVPSSLPGLPLPQK
jgi:hypothetical protein